MILLLFSAHKRQHWRGLLAALMLLVCFLAFDPTPRGPATGHLDKWQHLLAFVPLSFAAPWALGASKRLELTWWSLGCAGLYMLAFGVFIELVQAFIPARSASLADVLADVLGILLGLLLALATGRALRKAAVGAEAKAKP